MANTLTTTVRAQIYEIHNLSWTYNSIDSFGFTWVQYDFPNVKKNDSEMLTTF